MAKRTKSVITKRVDRVRHRLERGIQWAKDNGLTVACGTWHTDRCVCPIGAYIAKEHGVTTLDELNEGYQEQTGVDQFKGFAELLNITSGEVAFFISGVDGEESDFNSTPRREAMFRLGQRIAEKHNLSHILPSWKY
jgi:hypothetical protein